MQVDDTQHYQYALMQYKFRTYINIYPDRMIAQTLEQMAQGVSSIKNISSSVHCIKIIITNDPNKTPLQRSVELYNQFLRYISSTNSNQLPSRISQNSHQRLCFRKDRLVHYPRPGYQNANYFLISSDQSSSIEGKENSRSIQSFQEKIENIGPIIEQLHQEIKELQDKNRRLEKELLKQISELNKIIEEKNAKLKLIQEAMFESCTNNNTLVQVAAKLRLILKTGETQENMVPVPSSIQDQLDLSIHLLRHHSSEKEDQAFILNMQQLHMTPQDAILEVSQEISEVTAQRHA